MNFFFIINKQKKRLKPSHSVRRLRYFMRKFLSTKLLRLLQNDIEQPFNGQASGSVLQMSYYGLDVYWFLNPFFVLNFYDFFVFNFSLLVFLFFGNFFLNPFSFYFYGCSRDVLKRIECLWLWNFGILLHKLLKFSLEIYFFVIENFTVHWVFQMELCLLSSI